jgi:dolichol-phosphate mannosyltransferase
MLLSIIVPAFNEEDTILEVIKNLQECSLPNGLDREIIVVNDGSTDTTSFKAKSVENVVVIDQKNMGKGSAVQAGVKIAKGNFVLVQDADLEYTPDDIKYLINPILNNSSNNMSVYGRRKKSSNDNSNKFISWLKKHPEQKITSWIANLSLTILVLILYQKFISDTLTGYKIYPTSFLKSLDIKTSGFETDHEITVSLIEKKMKIVEVPISFSPRGLEEGKKIGLLDFFIAIYVYVSMRFSPPLWRFILTGGSTFVVDFTLFIFASRFLELDIKTARIFSLSFAIVFNFLLNKTFVFKKKGEWLYTNVKYLLTISFTASINYFVMLILISILGIYDLHAIMIGAILVAALNYILHKNWSFK